MALFSALGVVAACGGPDGSSGGPGETGGAAGTPVGGRSGGGTQAIGASSNAESGRNGGGHPGAAGSEGGAGGAPASNAGAANERGSDEPSSGAGGAESQVEVAVFERVSTVPADKMDLLFVIDNSISMADKQALFQDAVPVLVQRLVTPVCVDAAGVPTGVHAGADGSCARGEPEFPAIRDIHVGVITSSLGAHGGETCSEESTDDKAQLIGSTRPDVASWNDVGFLAWDPDGDRNDPPGEADAETLVLQFTDMVAAVGDTGCGYEATLEAWYRFLVDPEPPSGVRRSSNTSSNEVLYPDPLTLAQRAAFLRPDSLVGIVLLTDENDCSIVDEGSGWIVATQTLQGSAFRMPRAASVCATDPNDPCCLSCAINPSAVPPQCDLANDSECLLRTYDQLGDAPNLRCYDHKRRFGIDLLYPLDRYLNGLTRLQVLDRSGKLVANPLFRPSPDGPVRDVSRVFLTGIVGVPWQDVADDESLEDPRRLRYLSFDEMSAEDRWSLILGDGQNPPRDALMVETPVDRSTLGFAPHPLTGDTLAPPTATTPSANRINGHESLNLDNSDLQYACIFPIAPRGPCSDTDSNCDCRPADLRYGRAICRPSGGGPVGATQYFAKAYPGLRHLQLLRAFGEVSGNAVVASICPKVLDSAMPSTDPDYGYNPAIAATIERMKAALAPSCLSKSLDVDASGQIACHVLEVALGDSPCSCEGAGRRPPNAALRGTFLETLERSGFCGGAGAPSCRDLCMCEIEQVAPPDVRACQSDEATGDAAGFCYVDAESTPDAAALVEHCPAGRQRRLRFAGMDVPSSGASTFLLCE